MCSSKQLSSIPTDMPQQIEELFLDYNPLINLQNGFFSRYPFIQLLSCANCHLMTVEEHAFSSSPLLESLNLASNELRHGYKQLAQSLISLTMLRTLDLSDNGLTEDMAAKVIQNITSLETLNLSKNVLLRLDESTFRDLYQLKELNLERNVLFEIDGAFDHLTKLRWLNLAFNSLSCLIQFELTQLLVLNASHNQIEWFISNQNLTESFELETLDLSNNLLLFFPFLPINSHIKTLLLANNHIRFYGHLSQNISVNWITSVEFYNLGENMTNITAELWNDDLHGDISSVEMLDLSVNQVKYFPQRFLQKMPHLFWLKIKSNCLESLSLTEDLPATLYELDVSNNRLAEVQAQPSSVNELNNLTYLNLSLNFIHKLPPTVFSTLPSLSVVDLSYNAVGLCHPRELNSSNSTACAVWTNISNLKQLYIAGCGLSSLPPLVFNGTPLTHLDLSNNQDLVITEDCLLGLSGTLQHLSLSNTGLKSFDFSSYKHLTFLNISRNSISEFPNSLDKLNLKLLDLSSNMLSTVKPKHANMLVKKVKIVYLNGNSFNCCQLDWYRSFKESKMLHVADISEITCIDRHKRRLLAGLFDITICGGRSTKESIFWYILLFLSVSVSLVGISVIYFLTFGPRQLPHVIKKKCWRQTTY